MKKLVIMLAIIVVSYIFPSHLIARTQVQEAPTAPPKVYEHKEAIVEYAMQFGSDPQEIYSTEMCETKGVWKKGDYHNGKYHAFGNWQYWTDTCNRYERIYQQTYNVTDEFDITSDHDQVKLTAFVFSLGEKAKREWTTYVALKNGGTYTFYSKKLQNTFTIVCKPSKLVI